MDQVPNLNGKTVLITGATSGIGLEASVALARMGASLVMVGRDAGRTARAVTEVRGRSDGAAVESLLCDLASLRQVRALAEAFLKTHERLDVLVNNAGTVYARRTLTEDGIEATFALNYLSAFLLTNLLLERLRASAPSRIVMVSSAGHYGADLDFDDLGFTRGYQIMRAYGRSKLAAVLFTRELARRLDGTGVTVNALHPGTVATRIWNRAPAFTRPFFAIAKRLFMIDAAQGAQPIVHLASSPELASTSGQYFDRDRPRNPSRLAQDDALAVRLWDVSSRLVGLT
jgi:retinol dehydrogenase 14